MAQRLSEQRHIFGQSLEKSSENCWKYAEVAGTFSETPVKTGRKSHASINLTQKELASIHLFQLRLLLRRMMHDPCFIACGALL